MDKFVHVEKTSTTSLISKVWRGIKLNDLAAVPTIKVEMKQFYCANIILQPSQSKWVVGSVPLLGATRLAIPRHGGPLWLATLCPGEPQWLSSPQSTSPCPRP